MESDTENKNVIEFIDPEPSEHVKNFEELRKYQSRLIHKVLMIPNKLFTIEGTGADTP